MHHGGAGTTGATLRAGIPTAIKPFFGDQYSWALRVKKLGCGVQLTSLSTSELTDALIKLTTDPAVIEQSLALSRKIKAENGVANALDFLGEHLAGLALER